MLSIIIPTINEKENIKLNLNTFEKILSIPYEVIFVDDNSTDGTQDEIQYLQTEFDNVILIRRINSKGLASAAVQGFLSARNEYVCLVDADLQYDLISLKYFEKAIQESADNDLFVFKRTNIGDNNLTNLSPHRRALTNSAAKIFSVFNPYKLEDPSSGFFIIKRNLIIQNYSKLSLIGYKLLLDILMSVKGLKIQELPTTFNERKFGKSKLNISIFLDLIEMIIAKYLGKLVPVFFIFYCIAGSIGFLVQIIILNFLAKLFPIDFLIYILSSLLVMPINFYYNNTITFRSQKIVGLDLVPALIKYLLICSSGIALLYTSGFTYDLPISIPQVSVLTVFWNFFLSKILVWKVR